MKIALLLCGHIRTFSKTKDSFITFVKRLKLNHDVDIHVSCYYQQNGFHPFIQNKYNLFENKNLTQDEIYNMLDGLQITTLTVEDEEEINNQIKQESVNFEDGIKYHDIFAQYRKIRNLLKNITLEYNLIIKTRFDVVYNLIECEFNRETVYIDTERFADYVMVSNYDNLKCIIDRVFEKGFYKCEINKETWSIHTLLKHITRDLPLYNLRNVLSVELVRR